MTSSRQKTPGSAGSKTLYGFVVRVLLYAALMVFLNVVFLYDAGHATATGKFGELSATELLQELFLLLSGLLFMVAGIRKRSLAPVTNLLALLFLMAFVREFNNQISFWFYLVIPLILLAGWLLFRDRHRLLPAASDFALRKETPWFVAGFLVTFLFSRLFGRTRFWELLLEADYSRWAKNAAEEGVELLGCSFFLVAAIELAVNVFRENKNLPG